MRLPRVFLVRRSLASAPSAAATYATSAGGAETAPPRDGRGERAPGLDAAQWVPIRAMSPIDPDLRGSDGL